MRAGRAFTIAAFAFLFLAESQRAYFATLTTLAHAAVHPAAEPVRLLLAALPLAALFAPLLPLARRMDRGTAVALAVAGMAVFRVPMSLDVFAARLVASALVLSFCGLFLAWGVGWLDRRAVAAGAVAGLVADQLLRLAGASWDLSLQPAWLPVQAALSLALVALVLRRPRPELAAGGLERRAGGLRLRAALALGVLLFLDLHVLSLSHVAARWTGAAPDAAALATAAAGGVAAALALAWPAPLRGRWPAVGMALLIGATLVLGPRSQGLPGALLVAAGHAAALLLVARALHPAGGRRSPAVVPTALVVLAAFTALYTATFFYPSAPPPLGAGAAWVLGAAVALLAGAFLLLPEPTFAEPSTGRLAGGLVPLVVLLVAAGLVITVRPAPPAGDGRAAGVTGRATDGTAARARLRAGAYDLQYGFGDGSGGSRRFEPEWIAGMVRAADADVLVLHGVPIGMPASYGVDLPLWLERRLGLEVHFVPGGNGLQGQALVSRTPLRRVGAMQVPGGRGGGRVAAADVMLGDRRVAVRALQLPTGARVADAVAAALDGGSDPIVLLAALDAQAAGALDAQVRGAGLRPIVDSSAVADAARQVRVRRLWVRGLEAVDGERPVGGPSAQRAVVATLQVAPTQ